MVIQAQVKFSQRISTIFEGSSFADVIFVCADEKHVKAHKLILSICSSFLKEMFGNIIEKPLYIIIPTVKENILQSILDYIYMGEVTVNVDDVDELIGFAELLGLKDLFKIGITGSDKFDINSSSPMKCVVKEEALQECGGEGEASNSMTTLALNEKSETAVKTSEIQCGECNKYYTSLKVLKQHQRIMHKSMIIHCDKCKMLLYNLCI